MPQGVARAAFWQSAARAFPDDGAFMKEAHFKDNAKHPVNRSRR